MHGRRRSNMGRSLNKHSLRVLLLLLYGTNGDEILPPGSFSSILSPWDVRCRCCWWLLRAISEEKNSVPSFIPYEIWDPTCIRANRARAIGKGTKYPGTLTLSLTLSFSLSLSLSVSLSLSLSFQREGFYPADLIHTGALRSVPREKKKKTWPAKEMKVLRGVSI